MGVIAIAKPDPALVAVLVNREHSRLSSQVKTLEKVLHAPYSDKEHQRLLTVLVKKSHKLFFAAFDSRAQACFAHFSQRTSAVRPFPD